MKTSEVMVSNVITVGPEALFLRLLIYFCAIGSARCRWLPPTAKFLGSSARAIC